jgi:hypothetical protein
VFAHTPGWNSGDIKRAHRLDGVRRRGRRTRSKKGGPRIELRLR